MQYIKFAVKGSGYRMRHNHFASLERRQHRPRASSGTPSLEGCQHAVVLDSVGTD